MLRASKKHYIAGLGAEITRLHCCGALYKATVPVHEVFNGKTVWKGDVEVFDLLNHPEARRAYAWAHLDGSKDGKTGFVVVLEIPPINDAETAVQASIAADGKL